MKAKTHSKIDTPEVRQLPLIRQTTLHELGFLLGLLMIVILSFFLFYVAIPTLADSYLRSKESSNLSISLYSLGGNLWKQGY